MCRAVTCQKCGKTTWAGCGQHIDAVMKNVPYDKRCSCERAKPESLLSKVSGLFGRK